MFKIFKSKKNTEITLSASQKRWNKLWELYAENALRDNPVFYLCDYSSGVNGEGHEGFIDNNRNEIEKYVAELKKYYLTIYIIIFIVRIKRFSAKKRIMLLTKFAIYQTSFFISTKAR